MIRFAKPDLKIITAAAVLLCCLGTGPLLYDTVYKKTPEYAFSQIVESASGGDAGQIDVPLLAGQVFDALVEYNQPEERRLLRHITYLAQKDEFVHAVSTLLAQDNTENAAAAAQAIEQISRQAGFPVPAEGWHYQSASWSRPADTGHAQLTCFVYNNTLDAAVPWTVQMERISPRQWRIVSFSHLDETLQALQTAWQRNREKRAAAVQKQIDDLVSIKDLSVSLVTDTASNQTFLRLRYVLDVTEKGKSEIRDISGSYELRRRTDNTLLYAAPIRLSPAGNPSRVSQFPLNLPVSCDSSDISIKTLDDTQSRLSVTAVTKTDGTALTLPNHPAVHDQPSL